jgi:hypothetical protein
LVSGAIRIRAHEFVPCIGVSVSTSIPVHMPGTTVFHPKLTYLQGAEHDHLVVSSAKLTLAGHGKNLEMLDAVSSYREPGVFGEFAGFLEALTREHKFTPMTRTVLQGYQQRAAQLHKAAGDIDEEARKVWLIHTIDDSAANPSARAPGASPAWAPPNPRSSRSRVGKPTLARTPRDRGREPT